jgi:hypothetical protein
MERSEIWGSTWKNIPMPTILFLHKNEWRNFPRQEGVTVVLVPPLVLELFCNIWSVSVGIFLIFYQPIPKKNLVGTFQYCKFDGNLLFTQKGALAPFLMHLSQLFEECRSSHQIVRKRSSRQISARQKNKSVCWSVLGPF